MKRETNTPPTNVDAADVAIAPAEPPADGVTGAAADAAEADEADEAPTKVDSCVDSCVASCVAASAAEETPPFAVEPAPPVEPVDADEAKKDAGEEEDAGVVAAKRKKNGPDADNTAVEPASKAAKTAAADTAAEATAA